jgi:DNA-binding LytR/AlgR family response regulator
MSELPLIIRVVLVDDEEHARNELKYLLDQYPDVQTLCQASNCQEALDAIQAYRPHLVFIDIEIPGMGGIKLAEKILDSDCSPLLVFATAHEEFALKAFELDAVDYLLKPFSSKRLDRCITRVRNLLLASHSIGINRHTKGYVSKQKLAVENNGKTTILDIRDIILACCSEGQIIIYTETKSYQCNMAMHELQSRLDFHGFFRSHRAYLVNSEKIREIIPWFNGTFNLILDGLANMEIPVSRQQAVHLKKMFNL